MEIKDIKNMVDATVKEVETGNMIKTLLEEFINCAGDNEGMSAAADKIWDYLDKNKYVPEGLNGDEDIQLVDILTIKSDLINDIRPLKYAFVLIYHRFILSDILEKAWMARLMVRIFCINNQKFLKLMQDFIDNGIDDVIYKPSFDENDRNDWTLGLEVIRAVMPFVEWFDSMYPTQGIDGVKEEFLTTLKRHAKNLNDAKESSMPKFSALSRYFYEDIHK